MSKTELAKFVATLIRMHIPVKVFSYGKYVELRVGTRKFDAVRLEE